MVSIFWFRNDLRIDDNTALINALNNIETVLPIYITTKEELATYKQSSLIKEQLLLLNRKLKKYNSSLLILTNGYKNAWEYVLAQYDVKAVYINKDYTPFYSKQREFLKPILEAKGIAFNEYKDRVIFEENEIVKKDNSPYIVYSAYKKQWLKKFLEEQITTLSIPTKPSFIKQAFPFPKEFETVNISVIKQFGLDVQDDYHLTRDILEKETSLLSTHLSIGCISIRQLINKIKDIHSVFAQQIIWREFFNQVLFHFPENIHSCFKPQYEGVKWINNEEHFQAWKDGRTGYPLVDAGMRQLNKTGYMHNRARMVAASFLCKHLLTDWRWGEAYFAEKLLDYDLVLNNGNWQWAAGTGCDAAPYFRIFNPITQQIKFDPQFIYIKQWVEEFGTSNYPSPIIEHSFARERTLITYKKALSNYP